MTSALDEHGDHSRDPVRSPATREGAAPALRRGLAVLKLLGSRATPVSAGAVARELGLARSTTYELLTELAAAGFVVHLPDVRRWGLGLVAFELGTAYLRGEPLERVGRPVLGRLCVATEGTAHLGVLHGAETLYLAKEKAGGGPTLVTDVGIRLPAALTATGLSILAHLPAGQVRALFPGRDAFVDRTGRGPATLPELRADLSATRGRGWAVEDGRVSVGTASVAAPVFDHNAIPIAAVGVTVAHRCPVPGTSGCGLDLRELAGAVRQGAHDVTAAIGGRHPG